MGLRDISRKAVEAALAEFRRAGRDAMLRKYRGGASTRWYIEENDEHFDQKLVIRAAHEHEGLGRFEDFTAAHATRRLKQLGYRVVARRDGAILVCRVTWMPRYQSDREKARDGGSYVDRGYPPHESRNFLPVDETYYGFVENRGRQIRIEKLGAERTQASIGGITVVFCATDPHARDLVVVGWYTNATVHRRPIRRPGRDPLRRKPYFTATEATLIEESERRFWIPKAGEATKHEGGGIGPRSFIWYGLNGDGAREIRENLHAYMTLGARTHTPKQVAMESRNRKVSERLERRGANRRFINEKGYRCEACGWAIDESDVQVWGSSFELHHLTPFSELEEGETREVRSEDFAVLCASCHRAIHRTDYVDDVQRFAKEHCPSE